MFGGVARVGFWLVSMTPRTTPGTAIDPIGPLRDAALSLLQCQVTLVEVTEGKAVHLRRQVGAGVGIMDLVIMAGGRILLLGV